MDLSGLTALVTGASSGLGERFVEVLAGAGATVAAAARRADRLRALSVRLPGRCIPVEMDVRDVVSVRRAIDEVEGAAGPIDILVNNAGLSLEGRITDVEPDQFDHVVGTNLRGAFFVAQAVARRMIERNAQHGRIINIASSAGLRPIGRLGVYGMSKAGIIQMTKAMAMEWARHGIAVNAICPGYIETEINRDHWTSEGGRKLLAGLPRRRLGQPRDLDGLLLLLASDSSGFLNGAVMTADDGLAAF